MLSRMVDLLITMLWIDQIVRKGDLLGGDVKFFLSQPLHPVVLVTLISTSVR